MLFGLFKKKSKNDDFTKTKYPVESKEKFHSGMSQKERNDAWDKKIAREQALARREDIEAENKQKAIERKEKAKKYGKAIIKHTGHAVEGLGIIANKTADFEVKTAKKMYKKGKPVAKTFIKDMTHAGKVAAKGLGDWADRVAEDYEPNKKRKTTTRKVRKSPAKRKVTVKKIVVKRKAPAKRKSVTRKPTRKTTRKTVRSRKHY